MKEYQKLKQIIQEANPEIMELKFGCKVQWKKDGITTNTKVLDYNPIDEIVWVDDVFKVSRIKKYEVIKIFGCPIRIADVLLAIYKIKGWPTNHTRIEGEHIKQTEADILTLVIVEWNLSDDNLDHQPDDTKKFLIELLVK